MSTIGLVVAAHCRVAQEMVRAAELILGPLEGVRAVSMDPDMPVEKMVREVTQAIKDVDVGQGVIVLTDLFGGTPSNVALALVGSRVEVLSGFNLPMLIKFAEIRSTRPLKEAAETLRDYGRRHIALASEILSSRPEPEARGVDHERSPAHSD
ncbi:PTS sugar transporter subunit IIA [Desulfosoma caldarium]|uniref:PTS system mannose-specific IIA component n=1 Tax=Desulfosoma caldarium TaxID=610254 RepID=A0A3N1UID7_9BACT|nr:PTS sugar transporter subunit IIA [Desulfosoma caldarium]ROQ91022.1 PTS system mannose-specific IIA component [Desulfosoma caldarium]